MNLAHQKQLNAIRAKYRTLEVQNRDLLQHISVQDKNKDKNKNTNVNTNIRGINPNRRVVHIRGNESVDSRLERSSDDRVDDRLRHARRNALRNVGVIDRNPKPNPNVSSKLMDNLKRDEINEVYEFHEKYDGSMGEPALIFRDAMMSYIKYAKHRLGDYYVESRILSKIHKSLYGEALDKFKDDNMRMKFTINEFVEWYDNSFKLGDLRLKWYNKLMNWKISPTDPDLQIVDKYKRTLRLFDLTEKVSTKTILQTTIVNERVMVASINRAMQHTKPKLWAYIQHETLSKGSPHTLKRLKRWIERGVPNIEDNELNANKSKIDPTKIGTVNAISMNQFPILQNELNKNNSNNNDSNNRAISFDTPKLDNGGSNSNSNSNTFSNTNQNRFGTNKNYNKNYTTRNRNGNGKRNYDPINPDKMPDTLVPYYSHYNCSKCGEWGHRNRVCDWIHLQKFNQLRNSYVNRCPTNERKHTNPKSVNVTTTTKSKIGKSKKSKRDDLP